MLENTTFWGKVGTEEERIPVYLCHYDQLSPGEHPVTPCCVDRVRKVVWHDRSEMYGVFLGDLGLLRESQMIGVGEMHG